MPKDLDSAANREQDSDKSARRVPFEVSKPVKSAHSVCPIQTASRNAQRHQVWAKPAPRPVPIMRHVSKAPAPRLQSARFVTLTGQGVPMVLYVPTAVTTSVYRPLSRIRNVAPQTNALRAFFVKIIELVSSAKPPGPSVRMRMSARKLFGAVVIREPARLVPARAGSAKPTRMRALLDFSANRAHANR